MDKINTKNTINKLLEVINEASFLRVVNTIDLDKYVTKLTAYKFLHLLIIGQINNAKSLEHLSTYLKAEDDLHKLVMEIQIRMKQTPFVENVGRLHVIDSTTMSVTLSLSQYPWATFPKQKPGFVFI